MIKILGTADWHIGDFKGPVIDGMNLRSQDTINCLGYMVDIAKKERPEIVCVSGDIFHQEQIGPVRYSKEIIAATHGTDFLEYDILFKGICPKCQKKIKDGQIY